MLRAARKLATSATSAASFGQRLFELFLASGQQLLFSLHCARRARSSRAAFRLVGSTHGDMDSRQLVSIRPSRSRDALRLRGRWIGWFESLQIPL